MTPYEQGFITKCAEYGIDEGTASAMCKQAISGRDYNEMYDRLAKEYGNDATDYGYAKFQGQMPKRRGFFGRLFKGRDSAFNELKSQFEQRRQQAIDKHDDMISRMPANMRTAYLEAVKERSDQSAGKRALSGMDPSMRALVEGRMNGAGGGGVGGKSDRYGAGMRDAVMSGRLSVPSYANHSINPQTGELYRTDGRELHPGAAQWNMRLNYKGPTGAK